MKWVFVSMEWTISNSDQGSSSPWVSSYHYDLYLKYLIRTVIADQAAG